MNSNFKFGSVFVALLALGTALALTAPTYQRTPAQQQSPLLPARDLGLVDLHAHLFMKKGVGRLITGDFDDPIQAESWKDGLKSQANAETLEASGLGIVVVSLYAVHPFVYSLRDAVRAQIQQAREFTAQHTNWLIVRSPDEAIRARRAGFRVLVLSLEGTAGIIETDEDIQEFVEKEGIRIVTFSHLIDDKYGGAALLKGAGGVLMNPVRQIRSKLSPEKNAEGTVINSLGLTDDGRELAMKLMKHHAWLDLTHAGDKTQEGLIPLIQEVGQPLLYTHAVMRKYHGAERGISMDQLRQVAKTRGIVGLLPSQDYLAGTKTHPEICDASFGGTHRCGGGIHHLATQYNEVAEIIGRDSTHIGSDTNGAIPHLKPIQCGHTRTNLDQEGYWKISQSAELWTALKNSGADVPDAKNLEETFLDAWSRAWKASDQMKK